MMTPEEIALTMGSAVDDIDSLLELLAFVPDETDEATREKFRQLKGKPFLTMANGLRELAMLPNLTPWVKDHTTRLIELVDFARYATTINPMTGQRFKL